MLQCNKNEEQYFYISGSQVTREEYVDVMLKKVGKEIFVKYYYDFRRLDPNVYTLISEDYTEKSKKRRTSVAISLIRQGLSEYALQNIANSKKVKPVAAKLARSIYFCDFCADILFDK